MSKFYNSGDTMSLFMYSKVFISLYIYWILATIIYAENQGVCNCRLPLELGKKLEQLNEILLFARQAFTKDTRAIDANISPSYAAISLHYVSDGKNMVDRGIWYLISDDPLCLNDLDDVELFLRHQRELYIFYENQLSEHIRLLNELYTCNNLWEALHNNGTEREFLSFLEKEEFSLSTGSKVNGITVLHMLQDFVSKSVTAKYHTYNKDRVSLYYI